jgi:hypothetical protein
MANAREVFTVFLQDPSDWTKTPPVDTQLSFTESATVNSRDRLTGAALQCSVSPF